MAAGDSSDQPVGTQALRDIYLFRAFDEQQLGAMVKRTERVLLSPGQRLFNQGDPIQRFFYVEHGQMGCRPWGES